MADFVHLSIHSDRSLTDSMIKVPELVDAVSEHDMPAVALSDHMNMFGMIKFYEKCQAKGVKPISSSEITISDGDRSGKMTLIASNNDGYRNLMRILSEAYESGFESEKADLPVVSRQIVEANSDGIIALSGARHGLLGQGIMDRDRSTVSSELDWAKHVFGRENFYVEIQRTGIDKDEEHLHIASELAARNGYYVVATNPVRFLSHDDYRAHTVRAAINEKLRADVFERTFPDRFTPHMYLKSSDEMAELFDDIPEAIANSVEIARRCNVDLELGKNYLPQFPVPEGQSESGYLREESKQGLEKRLQFDFGGDQDRIEEARSEYEKRLDYELDIIDNMGFPGYFLIVADFIQWSKDNGIAVGPGRGSGAGSLVAYSLGITDLDPLKYDLLFERFLNPERVSMPDFDVDFCMDRRDEVIAYVADQYGHKAVSQIVTFGTLAAKMVVRDVARTLGYGYRDGDRIAKMIPDTPDIKLSEAINENPSFEMAYNEDPDVKEIVDVSLKLEGLARQTGKHAGGVLIAPGELSDYTPTYNDPKGEGFVSQYDKNDVETAGLVKFDFLGLRTLTIIQNAINAVNEKGNDLDILGIPMDDESVFDVFQKGETNAVFQVESQGMKELLLRLKPDCFEDLIALVALYRPGPLQSGMVDNFVNRKHGREEISYPDPIYQHELLKPILEPTYGIILYQEQVMQIAQELAGYSLGEADILRRAMGKKKPEEMAKQRQIFQEGAKNKGIDPDLAMKIFDLVEKFAGYGFNKSHSAAYALISYQTGWLKQHYPSEFMASVLSSDMGKTEKVVGFINETQRMGLTVRSPSINESLSYFVSNDSGEIIYGLGAIKGVGGRALESIVDEREQNGPYRGVYDFVKRVNPNKRVLTALINSGSLDDFGFNRNTLIKNLQLIQENARSEIKREKKAGETADFFLNSGLREIDELDGFLPFNEHDEMTRLLGEKKTLGLFLTSHPMTSVKVDLPGIAEHTLDEILDSPIDSIEGGASRDPGVTTIAGAVMDFEVKNTKRGQMANLKLDDGTGQIEVTIFSKALEECQYVLQEDAILQINGKLRTNKKSGAQKFIANEVNDLNSVRESMFQGIAIDIGASQMGDALKEDLNGQIESQPEGLSQVFISAEVAGKKKLLPLGHKKISLSDDFISSIRNLFGKDKVSLLERKPSSESDLAAEMADYKKDLQEQGKLTLDARRARIAHLMSELDQSLNT